MDFDNFRPEVLKTHIAQLAHSCDMPGFGKSGHIYFSQHAVRSNVRITYIVLVLTIISISYHWCICSLHLEPISASGDPAGVEVSVARKSFTVAHFEDIIAASTPL